MFKVNYLAALLAVCVLSGCEGTKEGSMSFPTFAALCETNACKATAGGRDLFVYLTKSSCGSIFFDSEVITGTGFVTCFAGSYCQGNVSTWSQNGQVVTEMKQGHYSVCAFIDIVGGGIPLDVPGNAYFFNSGSSFDNLVTSYQLSPWGDF